MAAPVQEIQPFTDISRWRLLVNEGGRHTWHYLKSDEECAAWPLTTLDKYWLGLPTGLPSLSPANDALSAARKGYEFYKHLQADDGHWPGEYGGTMFMLPAIVLGSYICGMPFKNEERLEMIRYLLNTAHPEDGGWGLHVEGESTVFGTALNYVSLRILGVPPDHAACIKARAVLHTMGGATGIPTWGKFWLCLLNVYDWEGINPVFPELLLLPSWLPVHPSRWWVHSRIIYHALCYLYGVRFAAEENELILSLREEIYVEKYYSVNWPAQRNHISKADVYAPHSALFDLLSHVLATYEQCSFPPLRQAAITHAYNLVVAEDENTSYQGIAPLSKMFNAIVRLHHDGPDHDSYRLHQDTRQDFMWQGPEGLRVTGTNGSQTWDTSFTVQALVETGLCDLEENRESVIKALEWLEGAQMLEDPKHSTIMYRYSTKGAWGFSTKAQGYTVSDCTAEALKAVLYMQSLDYTPKLFTSERLFWAVDLLLGLQNPDGGFASYEPIRAPSFIEQLNPAEVFANAMVDVGHTECTTSVITALSVFRKFYPGYRPKDIEPAIRKAIQFVHRAQQPEGGWYGSWGICFTYATMFALESLSLVGETYDSSTSVKRACDYLIGKQRVDGGWGESWKSCVENTWVEHEDTQVTQTCWAAMALMHAEYPDPAPVERAVKLVTSRQLPDGSWAQEAIEGIFSKTCTIAYPNFKFYFSIWMLGMASRYLQNTKEKNVWGSKESKAR